MQNATLIRHDLALIGAEVGKLGRRRADLLTVLLALPLLILVARAWVGGLPADRRPWLVLAVAGVAAIMAVNLAITRLHYHCTDGIVAPVAQRGAARAGYLAAVVGSGVLAGLLAMALFGLLGPDRWAIGTAGGLVLGAGYAVARPLAGRWLRRLAWRPAVGRDVTGRWNLMLGAVSAALGLLSALLPPDWGGGVAVATGLGAALLTGRVDADVVRFLTLSGHASRAILRIHLLRQLAVLLPFAVVALVGQAWLPGAISCGFAVLVPLVTALRILAYRCFARVVADWVVTLMLGTGASVAIGFPPAAPVLILAGLAWLALRAAPKTWLLR